MNEPISEHARKLEPDAIVAMIERDIVELNSEGDTIGGFMCAVMADLRDAIEGGDHLKGEAQ